MKAKFGFILIALAFAACNSHEKEQLDKLKELRTQDSTLAAQAKDKDSLISSYINTMGDIQGNLDSLKLKEKIITMNSSESRSNPKSAIMDDIKSIDDAIIANNFFDEYDMAGKSQQQPNVVDYANRNRFCKHWIFIRNFQKKY